MTTTFEPAPSPSRSPELDNHRPRRPQSARGDNLMMFAVIFSGIALIAGVFGVGLGWRAIDEAGSGGGGGAGAGGDAPATATVRLTEFALDPSSVTLASGGTLTVHNDGAVPHNLAIEGTDLLTPMLDAGASANLTLTGLAPGTYNIMCQVVGHAGAGMHGSLVVTQGGGTAADADGDHAAGGMASGAMTSDQMDAAMEKSIKAFPAKTQGVGGQDLAPQVLADGTKVFEVTASVVKWEVEPGKFVDAWTYNGTVPGPTIKVNSGDKVQVVLKNQLPESTSIHFHGLITPNAMDGTTFVTQPPVKPGETFTYSFTAQSTPAVGMYHSHHNAVHQVPDGLAGTILVGQLPVPAGVTVSQQYNMMLNDAGVIGFSLNGKSFPATAPVVAKQGEWIEVNYLNEGVMAHPMHMHGMPQTVIAKDGIPLAQPYEADTINVSPGERYTVLVHATEVGTWVWHCHILTHAESMQKGMFGMVTALVVT